jgi:hypothetical protein
MNRPACCKCSSTASMALEELGLLCNVRLCTRCNVATEKRRILNRILVWLYDHVELVMGAGDGMDLGMD